LGHRDRRFQVQGKPGPRSETLSQNKTKRKIIMKCFLKLKKDMKPQI
jgi:hypothetical protein